MAPNTVTTSSADAPGKARRVRRYLIVAVGCGGEREPTLRVELLPASSIVIERGQHRAFVQHGEPGAGRLQLADTRASSKHARLEWREGGCFIVDLGSKNGTSVNGAPVDRRLLRDGDVIEVGSTFLVHREHYSSSERDEVPQTWSALPGPELHPLVTASPVLEREFAEMKLVADSGRPVLVIGETGTGKELTARALHELSSGKGPFVPVNCGSIPPTLVESSFFGVKKGAFSGATVERDGWVRAADGGTLFLDEVAELSEPSQAALLRVLQEGEVVPVGGTRAVQVDVRFVSATHQDLRDRVRRGLFREDLYARLAAHIVQLPPLRERLEDLGLLAGRTLAAAHHEAGLRRSVAKALFAHGWPRNIRELDNALAHAVALANGRTLELDDLPKHVRPAVASPETEGPAIDFGNAEELRRRLLELYREHEGNVSAVARSLGKARMQVQRWNKRFGIDPREFRSSG